MAVLLNADTSAGLKVTSDTSGVLQLQSGGTATVTVDTSGNVGVGTTSPSAKLHVVGGQSYVTGSSTNGAYSRWYNNAQTSGDLQIGQGWSSGSDNVGFLLNNSNAALLFGTNGTERMRISGAGELLWGCTATSGGIPTTSGLAFQATSTAYDNAILFRNGADPTYVLDFYNTAGSRAGKVTVNASTTSYDTSSDYRLKENVAPMQNALATVALLKPVTYTWKNTGEAGQGFIAHELQEIVPDAVTGVKDGLDANGNPDYQGVDSSFLVATLTAAIQELKAELDATKAEVAALKGTV